jgi:N-acetylmuramoyl-L-alanine amidase
MRDPVEIAARTAWGEARGEGLLGMQAVLNTVGNRAVKPGWWGRSIAGVCMTIGQYSCWDAGDPNREALLAVTLDDKVFTVAVMLAQKLVAGLLVDVTLGSDSYYAKGSAVPLWARREFYRKTVGHHVFYRVGLEGNGL